MDDDVSLPRHAMPTPTRPPTPRTEATVTFELETASWPQPASSTEDAKRPTRLLAAPPSTTSPEGVTARAPGVVPCMRDPIVIVSDVTMRLLYPPLMVDSDTPPTLTLAAVRLPVQYRSPATARRVEPLPTGPSNPEHAMPMPTRPPTPSTDATVTLELDTDSWPPPASSTDDAKRDARLLAAPPSTTSPVGVTTREGVPLDGPTDTVLFATTSKLLPPAPPALSDARVASDVARMDGASTAAEKNPSPATARRVAPLEAEVSLPRHAMPMPTRPPTASDDATATLELETASWPLPASSTDEMDARLLAAPPSTTSPAGVTTSDGALDGPAQTAFEATTSWFVGSPPARKDARVAHDVARRAGASTAHEKKPSPDTASRVAPLEADVSLPRHAMPMPTRPPTPSTDATVTFEPDTASCPPQADSVEPDSDDARLLAAPPSTTSPDGVTAKADAPTVTEPDADTKSALLLPPPARRDAREASEVARRVGASTAAEKKPSPDTASRVLPFDAEVSLPRHAMPMPARPPTPRTDATVTLEADTASCPPQASSVRPACSDTRLLATPPSTTSPDGITAREARTVTVSDVTTRLLPPASSEASVAVRATETAVENTAPVERTVSAPAPSIVTPPPDCSTARLLAAPPTTRSPEPVTTTRPELTDSVVGVTTRLQEQIETQPSPGAPGALGARCSARITPPLPHPGTPAHSDDPVTLKKPLPAVKLLVKYALDAEMCVSPPSVMTSPITTRSGPIPVPVPVPVPVPPDCPPPPPESRLLM